MIIVVYTCMRLNFGETSANLMFQPTYRRVSFQKEDFFTPDEKLLSNNTMMS